MSRQSGSPTPLRLGLPKGRMEQGVLTLLGDAGIRIRPGARGYRPEVFPPEDADVIVDNTATGATLEANGLVVVDELMRSSTRLYANPAALEDPARRRRIDDLVMLLDSVLVARRRVMLEVNASAECLEAVVAVLPSMRQATVAPLFGNGGYAVKAAVPRDALPQVIPAVKAAGGTDLVVSTFSQIVP